MVIGWFRRCFGFVTVSNRSDLIMIIHNPPRHDFYSVLSLLCISVHLNQGHKKMSGILKQIAKNPSSVHITMNPVPRSIHESKQILATLQKFGEVATFRNLKVSSPPLRTRIQTRRKSKLNKQYDTSNTSPKHASHAIAIYDNPDAAARAISSESFIISSTTATSQPDTPTPTDKPCTVHCTIQQSHHNHLSSLKRNPYHTTFEIEKDSRTYRDLLQSGVPLRELADGRTRRKGFVSGGVKRGVEAENVRWGATSLWGLYRGCLVQGG